MGARVYLAAVEEKGREQEECEPDEDDDRERLHQHPKHRNEHCEEL
jgi:hypothetical protein